MSQKAILTQFQGVQSNSISCVKRIGWVSLTFDNIKLAIDSYLGMGSLAEPRKDSLIEIVTEKQVYEMSPETLLKAIDYYYGMNAQGSEITAYKNRKHVITPDLFKNEQNAQEKAKNGLET